MTGEKRSSDLSRLSVKRGGKLISKTLSKSSSPPSISAPPKAAVGASKAKKDEVQRRKNSFQDMFKSSSRDKDGAHALLLNVSTPDATLPSSSSSHGVSPRTATTDAAADGSRSLRSGEPSKSDTDRLAALERAFALAQEETATLRQELDRVKQDAQAAAEISRYQADEAHRHESIVESPRQKHQRVDEIEDDLVAQNLELRSRLTELEDELTTRSTVRSEKDWDDLALRLHEAEKESHSRFQQLLSLKSSISSLTRADSQVSDSELADSFSQLANRVREWTVKNYRRNRPSFDNLPNTTIQTLRSIKVKYEETDGAEKLALYQAIVSRTLMHIFEEPLVVGMPDQGVFAGLRAFFEGTQHVGAESWRRATLLVVERSVQMATIRDWRDKKVDMLASELEATMRSISSTDLTTSARAALIGILKSTADLQWTLCMQRAKYCVVFLDALHDKHRLFDDRAMEPVNDLEYSLGDGVELGQRGSVFCVFPSLEKIENGITNIVFKARVCRGVG
ncbi:hypothetical protein C7974DRAFT_37353 [Boeremia exigua]|uniref:uncharacterized protein n=1 Tax=Boeremia exigua TaxID=749465 RepID=UPI001E8EB92A|nr:uncharacterized protein C7974DRAFT_37353 [Boeremia exigua]KAH6618796.1 hypothetical protein C7974DRAFT_37353 [Boeremia exigua]